MTGALVARAEALGCALADLPLHEMQRVEKRITRAVYRVLTVERSVASRTGSGRDRAGHRRARGGGGEEAFSRSAAMKVVPRLLALVLIVAALAACGKKGPPQPPPGVPNTYPQNYPKQ